MRAKHTEVRAKEVLERHRKEFAAHQELVGHCDERTCKGTRKGEACRCNCGTCAPRNNALERAHLLEHCGQSVCIQRLSAGNTAVWPTCRCDCSACERIANVAGITRTKTGIFEDLPLEELGDLELEPESPAPLVVTAAGAAAGAAAGHRLRVLAEEYSSPSGLRSPPLTGSKVGLLDSGCLYWLRADTELDEREGSDHSLAGTLGHTFAEEEAHAPVSAERLAELAEQVPLALREGWLQKIQHVRRWLAELELQPGRWTERPMAYDPEARRGYRLTLTAPRQYADPDTWAGIRATVGLGPLSVPLTSDLIVSNGGDVTIYDWCFGRTDKRSQLLIGCLAFGCSRGTALYVEETGIREVRYEFSGAELAQFASALEVALVTAAEEPQEPRPGIHCVAEHCPARAKCPATAEAARTFLAAPGRFDPLATIDSDEYAETLLSLHQRIGKWWEERKKHLETWAREHPITTKKDQAGRPLKRWTETTRKGGLRFSKDLAEKALTVLGASDEQIASCYVQGKTSHPFIEINVK